MNILFLCNANIIPDAGGIERVTYTLAKRLNDLGCNICFVALKEQGERDNNHDIPQFIFPVKEDILSDINVTFLTNILTEKNIDILVNQSTMQGAKDITMIVREKVCIKIVNTLHSSVEADLKDIIDSNYVKSLKQRKPLTGLYKTYLWFLYPISYYFRRKNLIKKVTNTLQSSDVVALLSERQREKYLKLSLCKEYNNISVIPNPCTYKNIVPVDYGVRKNQILFVSRMTYSAKRPDRMLKIWSELHAKYPGWKLIVIGSGPDLPSIRNFAIGLNLRNVSFLGSVDPTSYYRESKLLCLTSTHEGFGMVLLEAMQNGCVPMAYDSFETLRDVIEDGVNGYCIPSFNSSMYRRKLEGVMNNDSIRIRMANNGTNAVAKFDVDIIANKWISLFESLKNNR